MPQIHLRAEPGDYAPVVLLPGDPNRATANPVTTPVTNRDSAALVARGAATPAQVSRIKQPVSMDPMSTTAAPDGAT